MAIELAVRALERSLGPRHLGNRIRLVTPDDAELAASEAPASFSPASFSPVCALP